ncbi:MAG: DNA-binding protein [Gammaproteobacteria bacterium RIFCSPLOWO2_02_FULL_42_14]|nr:MAG: DNA-binding protein [Gammaproteobacteria bacterium RIFCSPHIGHO2_02_FULL_42_43]OGT27718.1 MAG: DNA-binding protein [Gammaproteobacteria bacterium RIFCSPHIGHO2_01_FULL_42_8]OGT52573.1 MAG: DNA-binding protein [Gammaproteobacteria bacterium RIFCSPHIGHO2_12_FULL_41_25]OGT63171.1 MAG: DNA-binding protein [Gammaproteobacteria bacterium RIFCSPLOWO2_02_FULL_42_14]OGT86671.1 MAG: DNA-binding protein [Gammaproteobacteria bacterium RIFCSPLOWO2_12_FULL_42_18]
MTNDVVFAVGECVAAAGAVVEVVTDCDHLQHLKFSTSLPRAFTESGLYMLATILKSPRATETTISIIDTFTRVREIDKTIYQISNAKKDEKKQTELMQKAGELISELIAPENNNNQETEASIELNFAIVKFKYSLKKKQKLSEMM